MHGHATVGVALSSALVCISTRATGTGHFFAAQGHNEHASCTGAVLLILQSVVCSAVEWHGQGGRPAGDRGGHRIVSVHAAHNGLTMPEFDWTWRKIVMWIYWSWPTVVMWQP